MAVGRGRGGAGAPQSSRMRSSSISSTEHSGCSARAPYSGVSFTMDAMAPRERGRSSDSGLEERAVFTGSSVIAKRQ